MGYTTTEYIGIKIPDKNEQYKLSDMTEAFEKIDSAFGGVSTPEIDYSKIDVNIIVEYGSRIPDIAFEIQNRVKKSVEGMTGFIVEEVNVHVQGVKTDIVKDVKKEESLNEEEQ